MSVESTTLERSALERKSREELAVIARTLGAKTRTRDRKAEIVQAILDKVGAGRPDRSGDSPEGVNGDSNSADVRARSRPNQSDDRDLGGASVSQHMSEQPKPEAGGGAEPDPAPSASGGERPASDGGATPRVEPATDASTGSGTGQTGTPGRPEAQAGAGSRDAGAASGESKPADQPRERQAEAKPESQGDAQSGRQAGQRGTSQPERQDKPAQGGGRQGQRSQGRGEQRNGNRGGNSGGGGGGSSSSSAQDDQANRRRRRRGRNRGAEGTGPEEYTGDPIDVEGYLDLRDEGYGFLRVKGSRPSKDDIYVSVKQARQFGLRRGDFLKGGSRPALRNEKNPALLRIDQVNGQDPEKARNRRKFGDLTPLFPDEKLRLEVDDAGDMTARIIDIISPIGKGQRGLIVSPPKAGKTTIIKQIVRSIEINNPEVKLMVLQVDERPEEVTDMRRWLRNPTSEVLASTFDRPAEEHTQVAELAIERAKRLVEDGQDVCIVLDGITRLARAYNLAAPATGRIMSGGVDSGALYPPKKFFGAARNVEEGGSLTILATALIETGSKMDEVIFEEFKGTGNMELRLDRRLAERRVYPAIDVDASSTRHEELLFDRGQLNLVWALRRVLSGLSSSDGGNAAALELLIDRMKTFRTNGEFLAEVAKNRLGS